MKDKTQFAIITLLLMGFSLAITGITLDIKQKKQRLKQLRYDLNNHSKECNHDSQK